MIIFYKLTEPINLFIFVPIIVCFNDKTLSANITDVIKAVNTDNLVKLTTSSLYENANSATNIDIVNHIILL